MRSIQSNGVGPSANPIGLADQSFASNSELQVNPSDTLLLVENDLQPMHVQKAVHCRALMCSANTPISTAHLYGKNTSNPPSEKIISQIKKSRLFTREQAPIRIVKDELEIQQHCKSMIKDFENWQADVDSIKNKTENTSSTFTEEETTWKKRIFEARITIGFVRNLDVMASQAAFYFVNEQPIGILVVNTSPSNNPRKSDSLYIEILVTHPGSLGAGGALIECAVELSMAAGNGGKCHLEALKSAANAYSAMGFVIDQPKLRGLQKMSLNPSENQKWMKQGETWKLKSHVGEKYIAGFGKIILQKNSVPLT